MAGVLSFALGLESSAFSAGLDRAGGRLLAFLSVGKAVETAFDGVWSAIERGGKLNDLSARTGETVAVLYQLEEAFNVVGISADAVPGMVNKLNKSLSGVGEMGEKTDEAFAALGLRMSDLKKMDAPAQFNAVATALAKLDKGSAVDVASRLFGREGSGNILQISRDLQGFQETLSASAREALVFSRNAAAFDKLGDSITRIKGQVGGLFAGVAESVTPQLQRIADKLGSLDFVSFGQRIGDEIAMAFKAIDLGQFGEYWTLTLQAGVQDASNTMMQKITQWMDAMDKDKQSGQGGFFDKLGRGALGVGQGLLGLWDQAGAFMGVSGQQEQADKRFLQAQQNFDYAGIGNGVLASVADAASRGMEGAVNEYAQKLEGMRKKLATKSWLDSINAQDEAFLKANLPGKSDAAQAADALALGLDSAEQNANTLAKMGFIGSGSALDPGKETAANTKTLVAEVRKTNTLLGKQQNNNNLTNE